MDIRYIRMETEMTVMEKTTGDAQRERLEQQIRFVIEVDRVKKMMRSIPGIWPCAPYS